MTRSPRHTRPAILAAAAVEFADHGFAGTSVDTIASRAGVNKAMIYYHFEDKNALYVEVVRRVLREVGSRTGEVVASSLDPAGKIEGFIDVFRDEVTAHPYLPRIMMREMAEGATHLDPVTLEMMTRVFGNLFAILDEGWRKGVFRKADPILTHFSLIVPLAVFHSTKPIRAAMAAACVLPPQVRNLTFDTFVEHLKTLALAALAAAPAAAPASRRRSRTRSARPGDRA